MHVHVYKINIIIKVIVYIFMTITSFESWTIYVIYIVSLIGFSLSNLRDKELNFV